MKIILLSGLGPIWPAASFWDSDILGGTFFDRKQTTAAVHDGLGRVVTTSDFRYREGSSDQPLLRPRFQSEPHLTSQTLASILDGAGREHELFRLEDVWSEAREPETTAPDVVALSTTFICNWRAMNMAVAWVERRFPMAKLVVGGQYSNLKYMRLMRDLPRIDYIVRGDGELAFPMLLDALEGKAALGQVPNLVMSEPGRLMRPIHVNEFAYIDVEKHPSPRFSGSRTIVPYESMRGCPFTCKFCSFPAASPKWRYKSADKICSDWAAYARENGASLIKSLDSTFTIPPARFRELLEKLPAVGVAWDAYTRANVIKDREVVSALGEAHCASLSIGFESMSDASLDRMHKQVSAAQNRRANALLAEGDTVDYRGSFMIGYPGETPEEYEETHRFLVDEFARHFMLNPFNLIDETMPVWNDAARFGLVVENIDDPDSAWKHHGMDIATARDLHRRTLREVRWKNDRAVAVLWQMPFQSTLNPHVGLLENYRIQKSLERLAFAPKDFAGSPSQVRSRSLRAVEELDRLGVFLAPESRAVEARVA
ncbi:B12-binding domain-containing radical SAM protein [Pendulispora albinea]|uniref:B12-binding domain-containing radical SAM protein n=1 Tax=Pendulispora albinea TaxID=2741071 RepID=A0ABZ2LPJ7_9BACT